MAECMFPYYVERQLYHSQKDRYVPVPCGKCPECLKRRTASWAFRLEKESELWKSQYFVTLTYDGVHCPLSRNNFMSLRKKDLQDFFKRVRKVSKIRYYAVGEYGTKLKRPHYHLIMFSNDAIEQVIYDQWKFGSVYFGKVESGSIRYTVQYYDKGDWKPSHARDDRESEFSVMSKKLGANFLTESMVNYLLSNPSVGYVYENEGRKMAIPRYYKKRIYQYEGTKAIVEAHPSFLVHRDERKEALKVHQEAIKEFMESKPKVEDSVSLHAARNAAIANFRKNKRKLRD